MNQTARAGRVASPDAGTGAGTAPQQDETAPALPQIGLDGFAPYLINRVSARYNADMAEALRAQGLTTAKMRALAVLSVHSPLTVNELAVYAVMEQSTMSRTLDAMADSGLVERRPRAGDGRVREVVLTRAGEALFRDVWPVMRAQEERMLKSIPPQDRAALLSTLGQILRNIRKHPL